MALGAAAVAASAALASGPAVGVGVGVARAAEPRAPAPTPAPVASPSALAPPAVPLPATPAPSTSPVPQEAPAVGVFLKSDARGVARMPLFSHWLGGTELRAGHTYLPGHRWRDIEGAPDFLDVWAQWRNKKADRMLVLNVPMQERNEEGISDNEVRRLLRQGAAGEFDHHFRVLAERLVDLKVPDTILVLGWEMNGTTYTHRCGPDPEAWKKYWNRIVTTMRSVPGQKFRFDFTPSRGVDAVPWTKCYPGDDTVDIIGMDSYDQPTGMSFEQQVKEPYGLQDHVDFARAHGKPISYPEWGLFRNGDNPEYMRSMLDWMDEHRPLYNTLTDYCPHGVWQCAANPKSSHLYRSALFGRTDEATSPGTPTPQPTPSTPPGTPPPPADCTPLDLGSWVEEWLGGKLCLRFDWW
ncbi:secreted protein [Streptomyces viridochromogenes DSM 40736]|uniref:Secreted protein n=1 Tax=Streptomyces viridochromogenes (strain DSM 40736 / JCM 4977 / BCRC 1201 / Tue 494) TaxID=591159 RepID=D9XAT5_STRVT|nr:secreted protein [Streptomyces viridochromogenes DSM 40736]